MVGLMAQNPEVDRVERRAHPWIVEATSQHSSRLWRVVGGAVGHANGSLFNPGAMKTRAGNFGNPEGCAIEVRTTASRWMAPHGVDRRSPARGVGKRVLELQPEAGPVATRRFMLCSLVIIVRTRRPRPDRSQRGVIDLEQWASGVTRQMTMVCAAALPGARHHGYGVFPQGRARASKARAIAGDIAKLAKGATSLG